MRIEADPEEGNTGQTADNSLTQRQKLDRRITNLIIHAPKNSTITLKLIINKGELSSWIIKDIEDLEA